MKKISWNHRTSTPHRSEKKGIADRAVQSVKEGTSVVLLQSGLDEKWLVDSWECYCYLRNIQDLLADGKIPYERRFGEPFKGPTIPLGAIMEHHPTSECDQSRVHETWQECLTRDISWVCCDRGENLERRYSDNGHRRIEGLGRTRYLPSRNQRKRSIDHTTVRKMHLPSSRWCSKIARKRLRIPRTHSKAETNRRERATISVDKFKANRKSLNRQHQKMTLEPGKISGRDKVTSFIVFTVNLEFNFMCPKKTK